MLRGIEVGDILNTVKENVLLRGLAKEENLDYLKTVINYKSAIFNSGGSTAEELSKLISKYEELRNPQIIAERDKAVKDKQDQLKSLSSMDLTKIKIKKNTDLENFAKSKKSGEIKII